MNTLQLIQNPIEREMHQFCEVFDSFLTHPNKLLNEILQQIAQRKGKMMRSMLTLLSAKLFDGVDQKTMYAAASFEYFHNASLIHDDVVDESAERRGKESANHAFGNKAAVLMGDYLLALSLKTAALTENPHFVFIISKAAEGLSDGELLQLRSVFNQEISEETYFKIIKAKTATLFAACGEGGAMMGHANHEDTERMRQFGELVGLCFQMKDDIFDYLPEAQIGKPTGNDMQEGKLTLPVIYALYKTNKEEMFRIAHKVKNGTVTKEEVQALVEFTKKEGGIAYTEQQMTIFGDQAKSLLKGFKNGPVVEALNKYVDYVIERNI